MSADPLPAGGDSRSDTVLTFLQKATSFLAERGVDNPRLDAEVLLADVLGVDRVGVYLRFDRTLDPSEVERSRDLVRRRGRREPLQYVRGRQEFFSRDFRVDRRVLVPRPETETLVLAAIERARGLARPRVLEVGTGSGAIAVTLALELPEARVAASDVSTGALAVAAENARRLGAEVDLRAGDAALPFAGEEFDLVISNPPYIRTADLVRLAPEIRDFEPRVALDGGEDGLASYRSIAGGVWRVLRPGGALLLEIGAGERASVEGVLSAAGFSVERVRRDLADVERVVETKWTRS